MIPALADLSLQQFSDYAQGLPPSAPGMTLFCDFDGPIVDVSDRYYATYRMGLSQTHSHYRTKPRKAIAIRAMCKTQFWQMKQERVPDLEIALRSGLQGEAIDYFLGQVRHQVNLPGLLQKDRLQPGVLWALSLLKEQGFRLVLVTLRCTDQVNDILQQYQLQSLFDAIYGSEETDAAYLNYTDAKTKLLRQAVARHSFTQAQDSPATALPGWMIGDTEADVVAAQTLGIPAIALTCGIRSEAYLAKLKPHAIHSSLLLLAHSLLRRHSPDPGGV
ncbi:HAD family hydrolase [Prochlorothrix hollandica]|uniref:Haloacid dehalogenase n=1 Tax=Prochlorothrix hollandica PCC 9006 = CALU 1027 TaxID=317619 RepID=A0A0M2Q251_PROHO|nr:HAD hydrolase-like protein [Prochlorothrix hollandica]KKJ01054.1 haloacid dehalogenase [Prochlorothrix hollandica PCC 9006 = CALU 1027]